MKKWIFKDTSDNIIWETSVESFAEEFVTLLEKEGRKYVITIQEA